MMDDNQSMKPAIWSVSLAGGVWVSSLILMCLMAVIDPHGNAGAITSLVFGVCILLIFGAVVSSIVLAILVLVKRRKGTAMAIVALALSALPFLLIFAAAVQTALEPSNNLFK